MKKRKTIRIPDKLWICPNCGSKSELVIDDCCWDDCADDSDDNLLYEDSTCNCEKCKWGGSVKDVMKGVQSKGKHKKCPQCNGTGWIK